MKQIKLNHGYFALVDDLDYEYINQWKWRVRITKNTCYAVRASSKKDGPQRPIIMHRVIMSVSDREIHIDHKDQNGLNNTRSNLRIATRSENARNRVKQKNRFGYKGVYWFSPTSRYRVYITVARKTIHVGYYKTIIEAAKAYNEAAKVYHGEFASLNEIPLTSHILEGRN